MGENRKEYFKQYWAKHKKQHAEAQKKYMKKIKDENVQTKSTNKDYQRLWYENNKEKKLEYQKQYKKTPMGRANNLISAYKKNDKKYNRGECTLTAKWIVENIFSKPCYYCGETDWHKLGCDRINNNLPHTTDNVVSCCHRCNCKKH